MVTENKLGYAISSLNELPDLLNEITSSEYSKVKKNAITFSKDLRSGKHIIDAIDAIEQIIF